MKPTTISYSCHRNADRVVRIRFHPDGFKNERLDCVKTDRRIVSIVLFGLILRMNMLRVLESRINQYLINSTKQVRFQLSLGIIYLKKYFSWYFK